MLGRIGLEAIGGSEGFVKRGGQKGGEKSGDRRQPGRSNHKNPRGCRQQRSATQLHDDRRTSPRRQVVEDILNTPRSLLAITADKAYDSEKVRQQIRDEGALPVIPNRSNATRKAYCPKRFYRRRHKIENFFCRIKDWRRVATRYEWCAEAQLLNFHEKMARGSE